MKKVHVNIDNGPDRYREAVQLFKDLNTLLGATLKEQVILTGMPLPKEAEAGMVAPFARVDGLLIANATAGEVKAAIKRALEPHRIAA